MFSLRAVAVVVSVVEEHSLTLLSSAFTVFLLSKLVMCVIAL